MSFYPVNLDITGKKCAVIGGGKVALRKTAALLQAKALVTVISPILDSGLAELAGSIDYIAREYQADDLQDFFLVVCASNRREVNRLAAQEAKAYGSLVNVADDSFPSDFILPAVVRRGALTLTVSTGGLSPAFAAIVKKELETRYSENYAEFLQIVAALRAKLKLEFATSRQREALWRELLSIEILELVDKGNLSEARVRLENAISRFGSES